MSDWTDRLSDYLDGEMSGDERVSLEEALERDAELRGVLKDLQEVREAAVALPTQSPAADLWPGIASRITDADQPAVVDLADAREERRRFSFTAPQLAAAAVAVLVLGSAGMWTLMSSGAGEPDGAGTVAVEPVPEAQLVSAAEEGSSFSYEATIQELEAQLDIGRDRLDPKTVEALERSLATIDRAIAQAQDALDADPASVYLNRHLADARTRKISVLQQAALLASS